MKNRKRKVFKLNDSPARWRAIAKRYGISKYDYEEILRHQKGVCFICQKSPLECRPRRHLAVDHDHRTGLIRGLLCFNCNHKLLGWYIKDDVEKAKRIVEYLTREVNYGQTPE